MGKKMGKIVGKWVENGWKMGLGRFYLNKILCF